VRYTAAAVRRPLSVALLLFVAVEIWLLFVIGHRIGGLATFGLLLGGAVVGGAVARNAGRRALQAWQQANATGVVPGDALAANAMIVVAGALLMIPGVLSDLAGLVLLVPPVRRVLAGRVRHALAARLRGHPGLGGAAAGPSPARIIDVDHADVREAREARETED
jgi:UPF0716 protein FxsA